MTLKDLNDTAKLAYLKSAMRDKNLFRKLNRPSTGDDFYNNMVKMLQEQFDKPIEMHRSYVQSLMDMEPVKLTKSSLQSFAETICEALDGIPELKQTDVTYIITSMVVSFLPQKVKQSWDEKLEGCRQVPTAEELVEFIRAKADNPSYVDKAVPVKPKVSKQHKQRGSVNIVTPQPAPQPVYQPPPPPYQAPQSAPVQSAPQPHRGRGGQQRERQVQPTCRYVCPLCSETHYAFSCAQFESYSVAQRKEHASMLNLCTNCLKPGHSASNCRSEYHCRLCQGRHSTLLHVDTTAPQAQPAQGTVNLVNTPASPQQTGTLIMTCQVLMTGPIGKTMIARALLDTGATLSLISTKAMKSLGLTKQGTSVFIKGVDSVKNSPARPIVSVRVSSLCRKDWSQQVNVAVTPEVTPDLPLQGASSIRDLPHIQGLQLADPHFDQPGRVDLLLGEDSMSDILLPAQATGPPGTAKAWNTVFGWALRGAFTPDKPRGTSPAPVYVATCSAVETIPELPRFENFYV